MFGVSEATATRDLKELVKRGILEKIGVTGKGEPHERSEQSSAEDHKGNGDCLCGNGYFNVLPVFEQDDYSEALFHRRVWGVQPGFNRFEHRPCCGNAWVSITFLFFLWGPIMIKRVNPMSEGQNVITLLILLSVGRMEEVEVVYEKGVFKLLKR